MKKIRQHLVSILLVTIIAVGVGLMAYPSLANYWNSFHQSRAIMDYQDRVTHMDENDYKKLLTEPKNIISNLKLQE